MSDTQDFIRRDDVLAACDIAPPDEWNDYTKGGYDFAAEECKRNIAALTAIDPAAIREAALREAMDAIADYPRVAPDETEAQHYDEQIAHCQSILLSLIEKGAADGLV